MFLLVGLLLIESCYSVCVSLNNCNGHGICDQSHSICNCDDGWGSDNDISFYKSPDCSQRTCPSGRAWGDIPTATNQAHHFMECSNMGLCDRSTGVCKCFPGFGGPACNRMLCPNDCSGHGDCLSMRELAKLSNAQPLGPNVVYGMNNNDAAWDADSVYGCLCHSSWAVGLGSGQTQASEWFGADCSLRHCPSNDDPRTANVDETDCEGIAAPGSTSVGLAGNLCQVDCSNRGRCNYQTGQCECFAGYTDVDCYTIIR